MSYGIIQEHAGKIQVESAVGAGTTFHLEFPAIEEVGPCLRSILPPERTNTPRHLISATAQRILVIDDEAGIRESLEALLTLEGFTVKMAATA